MRPNKTRNSPSAPQPDTRGGERTLPVIRGRGSAENPGNRFERIEVVTDDWCEPDDPAPRTIFLRDSSRRVITRNDSPDIPFDATLNPYRGCEHGCIYCYARPTHEYLGLSAGLDFESRIFVKERAPELLREELSSPRWQPVVIGISGVTDPYQPVERRLELTRRCIEVLAEARNPVGLITKNHLVTRDIDLLSGLAREDAAMVHLSITTLDRSLQRVMEPRTSIPQRRLDAVRALASAGIPTGVMVAPVVPGLTDHELPAILEAARDAGARTAGYVPLRLPHGVKDLFVGWLERHYPDRAGRVLNRLREIRGGALNDPDFHSRMRGSGVYAQHIRTLFQTTCRRLGLNRERRHLSTASFRRPPRNGQLRLL